MDFTAVVMASCLIALIAFMASETAGCYNKNLAKLICLVVSASSFVATIVTTMVISKAPIKTISSQEIKQITDSEIILSDGSVINNIKEKVSIKEYEPGAILYYEKGRKYIGPFYEDTKYIRGKLER